MKKGSVISIEAPGLFVGFSFLALPSSEGARTETFAAGNSVAANGASLFKREKPPSGKEEGFRYLDSMLGVDPDPMLLGRGRGSVKPTSWNGAHDGRRHHRRHRRRCYPWASPR